jgi:hypothetical protein
VRANDVRSPVVVVRRVVRAHRVGIPLPGLLVCTTIV